jgi:CheY-like chemotaxis protein
VTDLAPDLTWARVDPTQLQTAILNLAVNARDAMPDGGTLRIATAKARPESGHPAPESIAITVSDTGTGMTPEVRARAFEPFFTTKEVGKGTGLGLSMVYSAIRQMGGEASIASEPGKGTSVRLLLPAVEAPSPPPAPAAEPAAAPGPEPGTVAVLYVEDEPLVRMATVDLLESAGYLVHDAADAGRALALLDGHPDITLMVTDVGLPGMNGHELAAEARRRRPGLRVVFLTGYDRDASSDGLRRDPAVRYLDKPYQHDDLFRALGELSVRA